MRNILDVSCFLLQVGGSPEKQWGVFSEGLIESREVGGGLTLFHRIDAFHISIYLPLLPILFTEQFSHKNVISFLQKLMLQVVFEVVCVTF